MTAALAQQSSPSRRLQSPSRRAAPRLVPLDADAAEERVLQAVRAGDSAAYAQLVERYQRGLFSLCLRMCGNTADADELTQEAFLRAYLHLSSFDSRHKFSTWIYRIALNACRDRLRSKPHGESTYGLDPGPLPTEVRESPDGAMARTELRQALNTALDLLPAKYREALVLRHLEDLSYEAISEMTGDTVGALKVRVVRGRTMLLEQLRNVDGALASLDAVDL